MLKVFIKRPVLATVVSLILLLLGIVGIKKLPITRFPQIAPPSVSVSASYSGADAATIAQSVLLPLETRINGVEDMTYIESTASTGSGTITIYFKQGTDPNQAAVNVQTRTSKALSDLPAEVVEGGVSVSPRQAGVIMTVNVWSEKPDDIDETFVQAYTNIQVVRELTRVDGVGGVSRIGGRNYAVRIWLNPNKMKAFNLVPADIKKAVKNQNFDLAPGEFGENSDQTFETVIKYTGRLKSTKAFKNIVIKTNPDGSILHLKDVAMIQLGATNTHSESYVNGFPGVTMNLNQTVGSNAREIDIGVRKKMEELAERFPKGMKYNISYSVRNQIDESIAQVLHTLVEAFILVFIIVFLFLQNFRATIIPAISILVSLIGTFFFIYILGFSINVLTMFALVLAIGIVVDDAIVVVEAIHNKMETTLLNPKEATLDTMGDITPAILSITMVMAAVFFPLGFMEGPSGVFYRQFAYTLAIAILISALNALTLSPALSALILRPPKPDSDAPEKEKIIRARESHKKNKLQKYLDRFFVAFNASFERMTGRYIKSIKFLSKKKKIALVGLVVITIIGAILMKFTPTSFIPQEDDGFIAYSIKLPPGSSLARTKSKLDKVVDILKKRKEIMSMSSSSGYNGIDGTTSASYAVGYLNMYPFKERKGIKNIHHFIDTLRKDLSQVKGVEVSVYMRPTVTGFGNQAGLHFALEDRIGGSYKTFGKVADSFLTVLNNRPEILSATTTFEADFPQYTLSVDKDKARVMGVNIKDMLNNVRMYYSRVRISEFNMFNRQNRVYVQAAPQFSETPKTLNTIYVRNDDGEMVPVNTLVKLKKTLGPEIVTRFNLYNSIEIHAQPAKGYSTGDAMEAVKEVAAKKLPGNYEYEWTGISREEQKSGGQTGFIIALSLLFIYFILSAQYDSYIIPFSILFSVPVGLIGVYSIINIVGLQNNIYVQVALIMLIGLLAKNAILIVEYSLQQRRAGHSIFDSAIEGAHLRLRPILMTSLAFVAGLIPLMWTSGPSAQGNHSISFGAAGGMLAGIIFGVFIVPVLFVIFKTIDEKLKKKLKKEY